MGWKFQSQIVIIIFVQNNQISLIINKLILFM